MKLGNIESLQCFYKIANTLVFFGSYNEMLVLIICMIDALVVNVLLI
jgi:hypothetical protein